MASVHQRKLLSRTVKVVLAYVELLEENNLLWRWQSTLGKSACLLCLSSLL